MLSNNQCSLHIYSLQLYSYRLKYKNFVYKFVARQYNVHLAYISNVVINFILFCYTLLYSTQKIQRSAIFSIFCFFIKIIIYLYSVFVTCVCLRQQSGPAARVLLKALNIFHNWLFSKPSQHETSMYLESYSKKNGIIFIVGLITYVTKTTIYETRGLKTYID